MRYRLLIYSNENACQTPEQAQQIMEGQQLAMEDAARKGFLRGAEPLVATSSSTTLRVHDGKTVITDGPFPESKEQHAGYYLLKCENLNDAIDIARKIPTACGGEEACVEIRPIRVFPVRRESIEASGATRA